MFLLDPCNQALPNTSFSVLESTAVKKEIFPCLVQLLCRLSFDGSFQNKATRKERKEREKRRRHWNALSERLNIN